MSKETYRVMQRYPSLHVTTCIMHPVLPHDCVRAQLYRAWAQHTFALRKRPRREGPCSVGGQWVAERDIS